jgi:hypothetical protein|tara:strand:+ start:157 stop:750 length:594 start_codon:yes stop_codon:yes gene_type:complete
MKKIFTDIANQNKWRCQESVSGAGSTLGWTRNLRKGLPLILKGLRVKTFLDVPCGDFNWAKEVDWQDIHYIGGDIVESLIKKNSELYENEKTSFVHLDLSKDELPAADVILVRDCLMHMSVSDAQKCVKNIKESSVKYILASTYPNNKKNNLSFRTSASLSRHNLEADPFLLTRPILYLNDSNSHVPEKLLGLWENQ